ncbi:MAG: nitroreductase family protein, partial [Phycisphaerae bacterium]|nr:nitroreductase family protein [Phycisphaerae bacterium]
ATSLDLAGVPMGGFDDVKVGKALNLPAGQRALYVLPIGHRQP